jgi:propionyl-CoA carboxylase alpha chain/3-methylcrotonyl-CoA carboxylase alpha subunit
MFRSVLVANRGEIARRVFRTAKRMGIRTIAVHSDADAAAAHVREADQAVRIGPAPARESYLRMEAVLDAARSSGAEAIHPGYGFLSENAEFAEAVTAAGLVWIGPRPASIRAMGLKDAAKRLMTEAGVPTTPGWLGEDQSPENLARQAEAVGFPVLIKAVAGGGGKGMKQARSAAEFPDALASARREAAAAFGDDRVLIERYLTRPRHIEVQVFGDTHGNVVHLFERDCSLQRRHQKVIEEAPAPGMDAATRAAVCDAAVRAAKAVDYVGAGTIEFIADASEGLRPDRIFFMEMNTRLQVEHPVTEAVTGQDLVEWQFRVAAGEPLPLQQDQITLTGHAVEARLYAEDPAKGFLPSVGRLDHFRLPAASPPSVILGPRSGPEGPASVRSPAPSFGLGVAGSSGLRGSAAPPEDDGLSGGVDYSPTLRIDSAVEQGDAVTPFYDPMIAKLIAHGPTREGAAAALAEACAEVQVWPVRTNAGFLVRCLEHPDFIAGEVDTSFIPSRYDGLTPAPPPSSLVLGAAAARLYSSNLDYEQLRSPWTSGLAGLTGWRLNGPRPEHAPLWLNGEKVAAPLFADDRLELTHTLWDDDNIVVFDRGETRRFQFTSGSTLGDAASDGAILSPMPGRIVAVPAQAGQSVAKGAPLVVLEAMKMEHALTAPFDGVVAELTVSPGDQVSEGVLLARLDPAAS